MNFDSFKTEFQYFFIFSAPFLVSCLLHSPLPGWSVMSLMCVSLQMTVVILSLQVTD